MISIDTPSPDDYFGYWHTAVEVDADRVERLREALVPACGWGDLSPLEGFAQAHLGDTAQVRWLDDPASLHGPWSPANLLLACHRDGGAKLGLGGFGHLADCYCGQPLLPDPDTGRFFGWADLDLDARFEVRFAAAAEHLALLAPRLDPDDWRDELEAWYEEQDLGARAAAAQVARTLESWAAALPARLEAYRAALAPIAARGGHLFVGFEEHLGR
jgi:hypothetical protein